MCFHPAMKPSSLFRSRLARDVALTLAVKMVFIIGLKFAFFSQPLDKSEAARRISEIVSSSPLTPLPVSHHDQENP